MRMMPPGHNAVLAIITYDYPPCIVAMANYPAGTEPTAGMSPEQMYIFDLAGCASMP